MKLLGTTLILSVFVATSGLRAEVIKLPDNPDIIFSSSSPTIHWGNGLFKKKKKKKDCDCPGSKQSKRKIARERRKNNNR